MGSARAVIVKSVSAAAALSPAAMANCMKSSRLIRRLPASHCEASITSRCFLFIVFSFLSESHPAFRQTIRNQSSRKRSPSSRGQDR